MLEVSDIPVSRRVAALPTAETSHGIEGQHAPRSAPRLSLIVPVHNGSQVLGRCLEALRLSEFQDFEVIVVDDCSTDDTPQIATRFGARLLQAPSNIGPGGARNLGVGEARGAVVVFVDADVVLPADALERIAQDFESDPGLAALFGSYDDAPAWKSFISQYKNLMHHYVHQTSNERAVTFWAGCGAMRKEVFEEFGGFDAKQFPYPSIEDIELGYRLTQAGRRILLDKHIQVKHLKCWTLGGLLRVDILHRAVPWARLILRTRNLPRDLNLNYASRVSAALTGLLLLGILTLPFAAAGWFPATSAREIGGLCVAMVIVLLALNWPVYEFFGRKRGWGFAAGAALVHWLYYFTSGVVFLLCGIGHAVRTAFEPARPRSAAVGMRPSGPQA